MSGRIGYLKGDRVVYLLEDVQEVRVAGQDGESLVIAAVDGIYTRAVVISADDVMARIRLDGGNERSVRLETLSLLTSPAEQMEQLAVTEGLEQDLQKTGAQLRLAQSERDSLRSEFQEAQRVLAQS